MKIKKDFSSQNLGSFSLFFSEIFWLFKTFSCKKFHFYIFVQFVYCFPKDSQMLLGLDSFLVGNAVLLFKNILLAKKWCLTC